MSSSREIDRKILQFVGKHANAVLPEERRQIAEGPLYWLTRRRAEMFLPHFLRGRIHREMFALAREFYKADPLGESRVKILASLQGMAEAGIDNTVRLTQIPERAERIKLEFTTIAHPTLFGSRYSDIEAERKKLAGAMLKTEFQGIAQSVVEDRLRTLSAEQAYRLTPRGRLFARSRNLRDRDDILGRALAATY